jgi:uncharacterized protein YbjT (DUF2867 family)
MKTAVIAGASGLVGHNLLNILLSDPNYEKIISVGRRKLDIDDSKLEQYVVNFENLDDLNFNANDVFCCLGTTIKKAGSKDAFRKVDFEFPKTLAEKSLEMGVKCFHLISAMGANSSSSIFYNNVKGNLEKEIISTSFKQTHIYRPSMLLGKRTERRFLESISLSILNTLGFLFVGKLKNYKAIKAERVAEFMLQSSLLEHEGVFIHLSGEMQ